jgi:hypothetical protein
MRLVSCLYVRSRDICLHHSSLSGSIQYSVGCSVREVSETPLKPVGTKGAVERDSVFTRLPSL